MARYLSFRDGGKTDEKGIGRPFAQFLTGQVFSGLETTQQSPLALGVKVSAGSAMIDSGNGYPYLPWNDADFNITLATADGTNPRYDLIVGYIDLSVVSSVTPNNPNAFVITKVTGTPAGSPTEPNSAAIQAVVGGSNPYVILARVTVGAGVTTITNSNISDRRTRVATNVPSSETSTGGYTDLGYTPSAITYLGNRSYELTFNTDLRTILSPGMRFRTQRTVSSPVQSSSLNGSSQYFSKSSPAGMTFTDDFVVSAWVKLSSYQAGTIASRYNGTSGWDLEVGASGAVSLIGFNAGGANFSLVSSYQSLPLNKWVHVTAQLDMSSFTATTTTSYVMIDGVDVPATVARGGTNPIALVQAGNLEIGTRNASQFFAGKIAQVAIYSAKVTQANIRATISQGLLGTETNLISAYSLSNSVTDLNTTNANNLTAQGSASTTNADAPWGTQVSGSISSTIDYGIVQSVTFSSNTTVIVQVPEGCTIPTSGGVSAVSYSTQKAPYGFPAQRGKWRLLYQCNVVGTQSSPVNGTVYNLNIAKLNTPVGAWTMVGAASVGGYRASSGGYEVFTALSTANNSVAPGDTGKTWAGAESGYSGVVACRASVKPTLEVQQSVQGDIYLVLGVTQSSLTDLNTYGNFSPTTITADNAYL